MANRVYQLALDEARSIRQQMEQRAVIMWNHPLYGWISYGQLSASITMLEKATQGKLADGPKVPVVQ
jgi:hypothetical protein